MSTNTNINLKHLLNQLFDDAMRASDRYHSLKVNLGEEAYFVTDYADLERLTEDDTETFKELEGSYLSGLLLKKVWGRKVDYVWHYRNYRFRITPVWAGEENGFIFYLPEEGVRKLVTFKEVLQDIVEYGSYLWESVEARMVGIADGYVSRVEAPEPAPDLKWKDGYSVDPTEAVKVPDEVPVPDGTLACADPEPVPDEVPVPEEKVCKPKKNWQEKRAREKDLIRAGGCGENPPYYGG